MELQSSIISAEIITKAEGQKIEDGSNFILHSSSER
jgi:hypothetical protein